MPVCRSGWAIVLLLVASGLAGAAAPTSSYRTLAEADFADPAKAEIVVRVVDTAMPPRPLPVRVIVTASDGTHPDGSGLGVYADGRFFADAQFTVRTPPGATRISLRSGPNFVPLELKLEAKAGKSSQVRAELARWFAPEEHGWYSGDNHVHAQHDSQAVIRTSLAYTALQGRANGLSYITEAGSAASISYADADKLSSATFLLRQASEVRPGPFIGHLNTPGIRTAIPEERLAQCLKRPLPAQAVAEAVRDLGGVVIHTHTLTPPHLLHWMGAGEVYSDAVLGQGADLLDVDSRASELLWFAVLNLGRKVACSSYTDCALGRANTPSPGDRRVYSHAKEFSYPAIIAGLRQGKTFATNGGPVFPMWTIDGKSSGDTIPAGQHQARIALHSLYPLKSAQLYRRGNVAKEFDIAGQQGEVRLEHAFQETDRSWYVLRVEDDRGHWAITSPIYVEPAQPTPPTFASAVILEISNHTRFIQLRQDFYAHMIVSVGADDVITEVELLRDGKPLHVFRPAQGNQLANGLIPVTEREGEYGPGWIWHPRPERANHFQADWPIKETGRYALRARTAGKRTVISDAIRFDAAAPNSHALATVKMEGADTQFVLWGYGEEMPLADIRLPFQGDHWWYPAKTYWQIRTRFGGQNKELRGGNPAAAARFQAAP